MEKVSRRNFLLTGLFGSVPFVGCRNFNFMKSNNPNVLLMGDSIRMGYAPYVRKNLKSQANVYSVRGNCRHTNYFLENMDGWFEEIGLNNGLDLISFNVGAHDLARVEGSSRNIEEYRENLDLIISKMKKINPSSQLVWATIVPSVRPFYESLGESYQGLEVFERDRESYNLLAKELMESRGIPIIDLDKYVGDNFDYTSYVDGLHFSDGSNEILGEYVANNILQLLNK